jgi:hypothetical protein
VEHETYSHGIQKQIFEVIHDGRPHPGHAAWQRRRAR